MNRNKIYALIILLIFIFAITGCSDGLYTRSYSVGGTVIDENSGDGLEDVIVIDENSDEYVVTDEDGAWEIIGLNEEARLVAQKEDWAFSPGHKTVNESDMNIEFSATNKRYDIAGQIVDSDGRGISGVIIELNSPNEDYDDLTTDDNGKFEKEGLLGAVQINPGKEDWTFSPAQKTVNEADMNIEFTATYQRYDIVGQVLDPAGNGVENVTIQFITEEETYTKETDFQGRFQKYDLIGEVEIIPEKEGWGFSPSSIKESEENLDLVIEAKNEKYNIKGQILDENDDGVGGVTIWFETPNDSYSSVETDFMGRFHKYDLIGEVEVIPEKLGWSFSPESERVSEENLELNFDAKNERYDIAGRIADEDGNGVSGVTIRFESTDGSYSSVETDIDGRFQKYDLIGEVEVIPQKTGWGFSPSSKRVSEENLELDFTAKNDRYDIAGRVVDDDGDGVEGVTVRFNNPNDSYSSVETDFRGRFSKHDLIGEVEIIPDKDGWRFSPSSKKVSEEDMDIEFEGISDYYDIDGRIVDTDGFGLREISIHLYQSGEYEDTIKTEVGGYFSREGLEGDWLLKPDDDNYTFSPEDYKVTGEESDIEFIGMSGEYDIDGRIVDNDGNGIGGIDIRLYQGETHVYTITTDVGGYFSEEGLEGEWVLKPEDADLSFSPETYRVTGEESDIEFIGMGGEYDIDGRIVDNDGNGIGGIDIRLYQGETHVYTITTDVGGYFSEEELEGEWILKPNKDEWSFSPETYKVTGEESDIEFTGKSLRYDIAGRIVDTDGNGVKDVTIEYNGDSVTTDFMGLFKIKDLIGDNELTFDKGDWEFSPRTLTVEEEDSGIEIKAQKPGYEVSGEILDDDGEPIENVRVSFSSDSQSSISPVYTDEVGLFEKSGLRGEVEVTPDRPGFDFDPESRTVSSEAEDVNFNGYQREGPFEEYSVSGTVYNNSGEFMTNMKIEFYQNVDGEWNKVGTAITDDSGDWNKENLWGTIRVIPIGSPADYSEVFDPEFIDVTQDETGVDFILYEQ